MNIRTAAVTDLPEIKALYRILDADMARIQPMLVQVAEPDATFIESIIADPQSDILLAVSEGQIAGFALVQKKETPAYPSIVYHQYAFLMDLIVDENNRKQGVGTALMAAVKQWARDRQLEYVELKVFSQNQAAIYLYEKEGFTDEMHEMRCLL